MKRRGRTEKWTQDWGAETEKWTSERGRSRQFYTEREHKGQMKLKISITWRKSTNRQEGEQNMTQVERNLKILQ